nr:MAG TPA: hypothetical protein [Bacteriophage sp.]
MFLRYWSLSIINPSYSSFFLIIKEYLSTFIS